MSRKPVKNTPGMYFGIKRRTWYVHGTFRLTVVIEQGTKEEELDQMRPFELFFFLLIKNEFF
ncbi:hypothetical protein SAMN05421820_10741 [Pedobacter steynii]|uniref:Uncharacterized protein n=1 Tax=Pedobacter steynii TaxID=430522 RepID=A0A1H0ACN6_9SPHI|nr:hypothetical protein SAMN05421820_10741 [Pedobacter steynii]